MKKILAFEGDPALAEELRQKFQPIGFTVDVVEDGNSGLQRARADRPDVILLTIELPKMNGFSICNKLKKNPDLKSIPLIIMSAEATEDTFQQHKKLRTHAEDYLRKPFDFDMLVEKVRNLVGLGAVPAGGDDSFGADEISIDTSGLDLMGEDEPEDGPLGEEADVEAFTESAFAALQLGDNTQTTPLEFDDRTVAVSPPQGFFDAIDQGVSNESAQGTQVSPSGMLQDAFAAPAGSMAPDDAMTAELSVTDGDVIASLTNDFEIAKAGLVAEVEQLRSVNEQLEADLAAEQDETQRLLEEQAQRQADSSAGTDEEAARLREEIDQLKARQRSLEDRESRLVGERENLEARSSTLTEDNQALLQDKRRLSQRIADLEEKIRHLEQAATGQSAPVSSRELLDLKQLLNRKDREIIDFKDELNAKEKALLEQRERITSLERDIADNTDKIIALERENGDVKEKFQGLSDDKSMLARKAEGLTKRLDTAKAETDKARAELEQARAQWEEQRANDAASHQGQLAELEERLRTEATAAKDAALAALHRELDSSRQKELSTLRHEHTQELAGAEERREEELIEQRRRHAKQLESRESELLAAAQQQQSELEASHQETLENERRHHAEQVRLLEQEHESTIQSLRLELDQDKAAAIQTLERENTSAIETLRAELEHDKASTLETLRAELERDKASTLETLRAELERDKASALEALDHQHGEEVNELERGYRDQMEMLGNQLAEVEDTLDRTRKDLEEKVSTIGHLDTVLSQHSQRIGEIELERDQLAQERDRLHQLLDETHSSLMETQARVEQVELWNLHHQARAEAAHVKINNDADAMDKAKRALAIALTLLADLPALEDAGPPPDSEEEYSSSV